MIKILFFQPYLAPYRIDFFNELSKLNNVKVIFAFPNDPLQNYETKKLIERVKFKYDYNLNGYKFFARFYALNRQIRFRLFHYIKTEKPNVLLSHEFGYITIMSLLLSKISSRNIKFFVTTDDSYQTIKDSKAIRKIVIKIITKFIDGIIVVNPDTKKWYVTNTQVLDDSVFYLPIITHSGNFIQQLKEAMNKSFENIIKYDLNDKKILLFVGRIVKEKGVDLLLNVFKKIIDEKAVLIIVGSNDGNFGSKKSSFIDINQYKTDNRVIFTDRLDSDDLYSFYNLSSCLVLPSIYEPFGAVVSEALNAGNIVLCSKFAGSSILIKENENGLLFNPNDADEFEDKLINILKNIDKTSTETLRIKDSLLFDNLEKKIEDFNNFITNK
jgi:glycosyltransferase involved in cell wall biosynthesis